MKLMSNKNQPTKPSENMPGQTSAIEDRVAAAQPNTGHTNTDGRSSSLDGSGDAAARTAHVADPQRAPFATTNEPVPVTQERASEVVPGKSVQGDTRAATSAGTRNPMSEGDGAAMGAGPHFTPPGTVLNTKANGKPDVQLTEQATLPGTLPDGKLGYMPTPIRDVEHPSITAAVDPTMPKAPATPVQNQQAAAGSAPAVAPQVGTVRR